MKKYEIVLSGVGGQGLLSCGKLMGCAATEYAGKKAVMTSSYGSEARGTFTKSDLIISDTDISFPEVEKPQVVLSLAQVAYDRYADRLSDQQIMIYDSEEVVASEKCKAVQYGFPFTKMARKLGYVGAANLVAAGLIVKLTEALELSEMEAAVRSRYAGKEKVIETNLSALRAGYRLV